MQLFPFSIIAMTRRNRGGQATTEYLLVAAVIITMVAVLALLLYTFREQSGRVVDLVASDYP